ncbi:MAG: signal peptidase II [Candidatus Promineifilaceae bacterium]
MIEEVAITEKEKREVAPSERPSSITDQTLLLIVTAGVILLDHLTKLFIETWLPLNTSWAPWPEYAHLLQITHVSNTGAAFGLFPTGSNLFMLVAILVAGIIIVYNYRLPSGHFLFRIALGLQLGGALGNLVDRFRLGHVTDFLDVGPWPVFNLADASIVAGVIILALLMFLESRETAEDNDPQPLLDENPRLMHERERPVVVESPIAGDMDGWADNPDILRND